MSEDHDPIIDVGLEELLGGRKPPDLTARIVSAWRGQQLLQQANRPGGQEPGSPDTARDPTSPLAPAAEHSGENVSAGAICVGDNSTAAAPISGSSDTSPVESLPSLLPRELSSRSANKSRNRRRALREWGLVVGAALAVAGSLILFAFVARSMVPANGGGKVVQNQQPPAKEAPRKELPSPASKGSSDATPPSAGESALASSPGKSVGKDKRPDPAVTETSPRDIVKPPIVTPAPVERSVAGTERANSARPQKPGNPKPKSAAGVVTIAPFNGTNLAAALDDDAVVDRVNALLRAGWAQSQPKVEPTARLNDGLWCERAFRIILNRSPNTAELEKFTRSSDARKRDDLLTSLVSSDDYEKEFANHWSRFWANRLMDPDDVSDSSVVGRDALAQYFRRGLMEQTSFRDLAAGLLTATGTGVERDKDFNGAAAFLLVRNDDKRVRATTEVARHFLGRSMECQQCHDDPLFEGGTQEQFWQLNSFLRQFAVVRNNKLPPRVVDVDFGGENSKPNDAAVFFTVANNLKVAFPVYLDGTAIPTSGVVKQVNRRKELATLITNSADFRRHIANQIWGAVVGKTFVPLDQKVRKNVMEHPEPLVVLGDQFAAHGFDLRKLVLWAARSEPFQLSSGPESLAGMTGGTNMPPFNQFYEQAPGTPRAARELLAAAQKAMETGKLDSTTTARVGTVPPVDKKGIAKAPKPSGSIIQAGAATSDPMVKIILSSSRLNDKQRAEHLFQLAEHRPPRSAESKHLDEMLKKASGNPHEALQAIWSALNQRR